MPEWLQIVIRTLVALIALFILTRFILGRRQITQLTYFEYITGITVGSLAAVISLDLDSEWHQGVISMLVWVVVIFILEIGGLKNKKIRNLIEGKAVVLMKDGKVMEENMKKVRYSSDDLMEQLRKNRAFEVADVEFAVLETSGEMSVLLKKENIPLTMKQIGVKAPNEQEPQLVMMDGEINDEGLATAGFSREWLNTELEKLGIAIENVFLGQVNAYGELYIDLFDDVLKVATPSNKEMLSATLKKCIADIELFALSTKDVKAKQMYAQCAKQLNEVWNDIHPLIRS